MQTAKYLFERWFPGVRKEQQRPHVNTRVAFVRRAAYTKQERSTDRWVDGRPYDWRAWGAVSIDYETVVFPDAMVRSRNSVRNKWHMSYEFLVYLYVSCRYTHELIGDRLFDVHDVKLGWSQPIGVVPCMFLRAGGGVCSILCNVRVGCGV